LSSRTQELAAIHPDRVITPSSPNVPGSPLHDHLYQSGLVQRAERDAVASKRESSLTRHMPPLSPLQQQTNTTHTDTSSNKRAFAPSSPRPIADWAAAADRQRMAAAHALNQNSNGGDASDESKRHAVDPFAATIVTPARSTNTSISPSSSMHTSYRSSSTSPVRPGTEPATRRSRKRVTTLNGSTAATTAQPASSDYDIAIVVTPVTASSTTTPTATTSTIPATSGPLRIAPSSSSMVSHTQLRQSRRDKRLAAIVAELTAREQAECTFKPIIYTRPGKHDSNNDDEKEASVTNDPAVLRYVDRQREARKLKAMTQRLVWITGSGWTRQGSQALPPPPSASSSQHPSQPSQSQILTTTLPRSHPTSVPSSTTPLSHEWTTGTAWGLAPTLTPASFPPPNLALPIVENASTSSMYKGAHERAHMSPLLSTSSLLSSHYSSSSYADQHAAKLAKAMLRNNRQRTPQPQLYQQSHEQKRSTTSTNESNAAHSASIPISQSHSIPSTTTASQYHQQPKSQAASRHAATPASDTPLSPSLTMTTGGGGRGNGHGIRGLRTLWSPIEERSTTKKATSNEAEHNHDHQHDDACACCGFVAPTPVLNLPTFEGVDEWPTHDHENDGDHTNPEDDNTNYDSASNINDSDGPLSPDFGASSSSTRWSSMPRPATAPPSLLSASSLQVAPSSSSPPSLWSPQQQSVMTRPSAAAAAPTFLPPPSLSSANNMSITITATPPVGSSLATPSLTSTMSRLSLEQSVLTPDPGMTPAPGSRPLRHSFPSIGASSSQHVPAAVAVIPQQNHEATLMAAANLARDIDAAIAIGSSALLLTDRHDHIHIHPSSHMHSSYSTY
jgi:hypothetical protein